jgi:hypothetical protein
VPPKRLIRSTLKTNQLPAAWKKGKVYLTLAEFLRVGGGTGAGVLPYFVGPDRGRRPATFHQLCDMIKEVPHRN